MSLSSSLFIDQWNEKQKQIELIDREMRIQKFPLERRIDPFLKKILMQSQELEFGLVIHLELLTMSEKNDHSERLISRLMLNNNMSIRV